jgi:hypothetical protein
VKASRALAGGFPSSAIPRLARIQLQTLQPQAVKMLSASQIRTLDIGRVLYPRFRVWTIGFRPLRGDLVRSKTAYNSDPPYFRPSMPSLYAISRQSGQFGTDKFSRFAYVVDHGRSLKHGHCNSHHVVRIAGGCVVTTSPRRRVTFSL